MQNVGSGCEKRQRTKITKQIHHTIIMNIQFTQGDTVAIPEGCTATIKDGIITFSPQQEPEQNFKDGDVLIDDFKSSMYPHKIIFIYKGKRILKNYEAYVNRSLSGSLIFNDSCCSLDRCKVRLATKEEKQELFDLMKEKGLYWNAKEKRVEKVRWRAEKNETYFTICGDLSISDAKDLDWEIDNRYHNLGNYFRTEEQAEAAAEAIKETLRKFHEEND